MSPWRQEQSEHPASRSGILHVESVSTLFPISSSRGSNPPSGRMRESSEIFGKVTIRPGQKDNRKYL